jgi:hypothetical protein
LKSVDKKKLWLLDSTIFDTCLSKMKKEAENELKQANNTKSVKDLFSDTVIFDRDSSVISTPIGTKKDGK